ncbi:mannose-6-phosphate isomerase-like [Saccoglossus kowalevskii]|uniref:Mannose-6-phosphate isomerase n=1 Tax=Saccoglossus kowalevskii TaxID=10224 RepID=A0ABM0MSG1_SACKO|nr:PREDICTED: mannose-6-phosphate isomerase-like [Saccoglossus kowalevskii]
MSSKVFSLKCAIQQYAWGRIGEDSEVAKLSQSIDKSFQLQKDKPYAELWMGTHPSGPSQILSESIVEKSLGDWIEKHPECLGDKVREKFKGQLPYLFKVLSVNKALSIQAHPNKEHAEALHSARPDIYKDPNHKPEIAIALTTFEGLCGFRPISQIVGFFKTVPEFKAVVGTDGVDQLTSAFDASDPNPGKTCRAALKKCFAGMMTCQDDVVAKQLASLVDRISIAVKESKDVSEVNGELLTRLHDKFPGDVGCFAIYFLNHMILEPGQAMYLGPNEPHAYLKGNCIECMACSDNVVRAGLTPKYKDVPTLCEMLTYEPSAPKDKLFPCVPDPKDSSVHLYNPTVPDFAVSRIKIADDKTSYTIRAEDNPSILIVISGTAEGTNETLPDGEKLDLKRGSVFFMAANQEVALQCQPGGMLIFRACCPLD